MKRLILGVVFVALAWAGWWFWQASATRGQVEAWFEDRRADGWVAEYSDISVRGFPNRLDVTLTDLSLADPKSNMVWEASFFQILSLSYDRNHHILIFPDQQTLSYQGNQHEVTSDGLRASVVFEEGRIERLNAEAETLNWDGIALATTTAALLRQDKQLYQLAVLAEAIAQNATGLAVVNDGRASNAKLNALVQFDQDWSLASVEMARPQPTHIDLKQLSYQLDGLELEMAGKLDISASGLGDGELTLRAVNWQEALERARLNDHLPGGMMETLVQGLSLVAGLKGRADTLDLPVHINNGEMALGLLPLGQAPRFQIP